MGKFIDISGYRFGRLTVDAVTDDRIKGQVVWQCTCDCGTRKRVRSDFLRYGEVKSCGCLVHDMMIERNTTHGLSRHPAYKIWCAIHKRCAPDNERSVDYHERGISVCAEWSTFEGFWADMGETWRAGLTLEREDNDKGYEPGNCVWADFRTQANNTRRNRWIDTPKGKMTVAQASREFGIRYPTLHNRLTLGLTGDALFRPIQNAGRDADEEASLVRQIADLQQRLRAIRRLKRKAL